MRVQLAEAGRVHDQPAPLEVAEQLRSRARPHLITRCGAPFYDERAAPRKARRARGTHGRPARYNRADGRSGEPVPEPSPPRSPVHYWVRRAPLAIGVLTLA